MDLESFLQSAVSKAIRLGADYADIRYEKSISRGVGAEDGKPKDSGEHDEEGFGIRARIGGAWGFSSVCVDSKSAEKTVAAIGNAVKYAKASAPYAKPLLMPPVSVRGKYATKVRIDPFSIPLEEQMSLCVDSTKQMSSQKDITMSAAGMGFEKIEKWFCSSEGSVIRQDLSFSLCNIFALARNGPVSEFYMTTEGGQAGYESITKDYDFSKGADDTAKKAIELVHAKTIKPRDATVVIDPDALALVVHEIAGHPVEADRVLGWESAWAGTSWLSDKLGQKIGSEHVTIVSDATIPGHLGSYGFDDEGVPAQRVVHMDKGVLFKFLHSRETAALTGSFAGGAMRAVGYQYAPIIRMTNTYMDGGSWKAKEIIEDTKDGVYVCGHHTPSIDSRRYNFQIRVKNAYEIKNGELGRPLRGVSITGTSDKFWSSIDAVANDVQMRPVPNCGKGDPMQTCMVGNGGPHVRAKARVTGLASKF